MIVGLIIGATVGVIAWSGGAGPIATLLGATSASIETANNGPVAPALAELALATKSATVARALVRYDANVVAVDSALVTLGRVVATHDIVQSRSAFVNVRRAYKRVEWLAEHYTPLTATALNGPALDKPDDESPQVIVRPTGLQVIEALLYSPNVDATKFDSVAIQARIARVNIKRIRERAQETVVTESQLFDAARAEIGRMVSLGISGFDTPVVGDAVPEASAVISSIGDAMALFAPTTVQNIELQHSVNAAREYLASVDKFESLDQFTLITEYIRPLANALGELQRVAGVPRLTDSRAWNAASNTFFDSGAFNVQAFAPVGARASTPQLVALGARLFYENGLSGNRDRSCATCHMASRALSDGLRVPAALTAPSKLRATTASSPVSANERRVAAPPRNTPTLYNAALQAAAFADARIAFLEDQITTVINNPREMGGDVNAAANLIRRDTSYTRMLNDAFGAVPPEPEMSREMRGALAAYLRSLVRLNSRFDRAMRGNVTAMSAEEKLGFNLFMGKARCGSCHFAPLFNGTVPPGYTDAEVEILGVPASPRKPLKLDSDLGAGAADRAALHNHAFKTPTVRNAAVTAPYMHNGSMATLEEVIDFYDAGGGVGLGLSVPNQTLASDSLHLSKIEKHALVAFIGSLTDTASAPVKLPHAPRP